MNKKQLRSYLLEHKKGKFRISQKGNIIAITTTTLELHDYIETIEYYEFCHGELVYKLEV